LYPIPEKVLVRGSPRLVQISKISFVTDLEAPHRCPQHNIEPNLEGAPPAGVTEARREEPS
jgi:hypothetical protein